MAAMPGTIFSFPPVAAKRESEIIGADRGLRHALDAVRMVAPVDTAVMIHGETGDGNEVIARAIHEQSRRSRAPCIKVNCAAIPAGLIESDLFGHERGAHSPAPGPGPQAGFNWRIEGHCVSTKSASCLDLQPKLLRILQEQEFERLGSARTIRVDVRIIAASNLDRAQMAQERRFRDWPGNIREL